MSEDAPPTASDIRRPSVVIEAKKTDDGPRSIIQDEKHRPDNLKDRFLGAIDQGTTSSRFIIFDGTGVPIASYQSEFRQIHEQSGYVAILPCVSPHPPGWQIA